MRYNYEYIYIYICSPSMAALRRSYTQCYDRRGIRNSSSFHAIYWDVGHYQLVAVENMQILLETDANVECASHERSSCYWVGSGEM